MEQIIAELWEIAKKIATTEMVTQWNVHYQAQECPFCNGGEDFKSPDLIKHESTCIIVKARQLVAQKEPHGEEIPLINSTKI